MVALDLVSYGWHRASHVVPLLWRFHQVHHSDHTKAGPERNTNFGTVFSAWDRVFGTYADNDLATSIETGLPGVDAPSLPRVLALPLQRLSG